MITIEEIKEKMKTHNIKQIDIVRAFNLGLKTGTNTISRHLRCDLKISKPYSALYYYYFKTIELSAISWNETDNFILKHQKRHGAN